MIFRVNSSLFASSTPDYSIGGKPCLPREITIIPQGKMNHKRIKTKTLLTEQGAVKEPELFGRGRPCPGAATSYQAIHEVYKSVKTRHLRFFPSPEQHQEYISFVNDLSDGSERRRSCASPSVTGKWQSS